MQISGLPEITIRPTLYEKGNATMWQDEHISGHLLQLHLNQDTDAASRTRPVIMKTIQWIESHLKGGEMTILDLGCGPGLYSEILAEHGHKVTGVDYSERSISYAKNESLSKKLPIEYLHQNYLDLDFENRFDLVMMIFCDFDVLIPEDRDRLLQNIYRALKPGGLFIFDTLNQVAPGKMNIPGRSWETSECGFWKNEPYLALSETFHYPGENVILQQHVICSEKADPDVYRFWTHYYHQEKLSGILNKQGFSVAETCEDLLPADEAGTDHMVTFYVTSKN